MISDKTYHQLINTCDFKRQKNSNECESLYSYAMDQEFGNIDQYNIYAPPCNHSDGSHSGPTRQTMRLPHRPVQVFIYNFHLVQIVRFIFHTSLLKFVFYRCLGSFRVMTRVLKGMQRFTTIDQMFKRHSMLIQHGFHINGLLAGSSLHLHFQNLSVTIYI